LRANSTERDATCGGLDDLVLSLPTPRNVDADGELGATDRGATEPTEPTAHQEKQRYAGNGPERRLEDRSRVG
jgi:hypothetical protein